MILLQTGLPSHKKARTLKSSTERKVKCSFASIIRLDQFLLGNNIKLGNGVQVVSKPGT